MMRAYIDTNILVCIFTFDLGQCRNRTNQRNATTGNSSSFKPGDKVEVSFSTVYHPANKLAGIYNMSASLGYTEPALSGAANQYAFASTPGIIPAMSPISPMLFSWRI